MTSFIFHADIVYYFMCTWCYDATLRSTLLRCVCFFRRSCRMHFGIDLHCSIYRPNQRWYAVDDCPNGMQIPNVSISLSHSRMLLSLSQNEVTEKWAMGNWRWWQTRWSSAMHKAQMKRAYKSDNIEPGDKLRNERTNVRNWYSHSSQHLINNIINNVAVVANEQTSKCEWERVRGCLLSTGSFAWKMRDNARIEIRNKMYFQLDVTYSIPLCSFVRNVPLFRLALSLSLSLSLFRSLSLSLSTYIC